MTNSNRIQLTWISFLSTPDRGAGDRRMVMGKYRDYFQLPVSV